MEDFQIGWAVRVECHTSRLMFLFGNTVGSPSLNMIEGSARGVKDRTSWLYRIAVTFAVARAPACTTTALPRPEYLERNSAF
jgi:hypothetical protein